MLVRPTLGTTAGVGRDVEAVDSGAPGIPPAFPREPALTLGYAPNRLPLGKLRFSRLTFLPFHPTPSPFGRDQEAGGSPSCEPHSHAGTGPRSAPPPIVRPWCV